MRTETEMVSPGTISPKAPEFHFASMKIFMPLMPSVFVLFSVGKFPFPLALTMAMGMVMLSFSEPSERRHDLFSMFSRIREEGWPWELRTDMEMVSPATIFPEVSEFHFASMRIFMPLIPSVVVVFSSGKLPLPPALTMAMRIMMLSFWEASPKRLECPLSRFEPGLLVLGLGTEFPRETSERRNGLFFRRGEEGGP